SRGRRNMSREIWRKAARRRKPRRRTRRQMETLTARRSPTTRKRALFQPTCQALRRSRRH
ncbi:hypothetical protein LTR40_014960, partial [Exophiala xenobiotica]